MKKKIKLKNDNNHYIQVLYGNVCVYIYYAIKYVFIIYSTVTNLSSPMKVEGEKL